MASSPELAPAETGSVFSYKDATEDEIIEDLTSRFILNLPDEELTSLERICFQVEQAHWYYEDFIREENPRMPSLQLKRFTTMMFENCPVLQHWNSAEAFNKFMAYKTKVPVCGAIMLNETWDKCVLVKGWKSSSGWGFPKGKQNEAESTWACAAREVHEETGYNLSGQINPEHCIEINNSDQVVTLFIVPGVPEDYPFRTKTRKEISKIEWFKLVDLPNWKRSKQSSGKFYLIAPFIHPLKTFINQNKPRKGRKGNADEKVPPNRIKSPVPVPKPPPESDGIQDSSSQSSSLDNGGPQTPSPQYTQSTPAIVEDQVEPDVPIESLDPHFAGLLSKLSLSATPASLVKAERPSSNNSRTAVSPRLLPPPDVVRTAVSPASTIEQPSTTQVAAQVLPPVIESIPAANASNSPMLAPASPRSPTARRTATADISPYLSKAVEVPMSARRLQQLALLESVAQESARRTPMLPSLPAGMPSNFGGPVSLGPNFHQPPASQPLNHYATPSFTGQPLPAPMYPTFANAPPPAQDPMMRSRTSQAFHRNGYQGPSGSMSMSQHQLLSLINGARPSASPPPQRGPPPPPHTHGLHPMYNAGPPLFNPQFRQGPPPPPSVYPPFGGAAGLDMNRPRPYSTAPMSMGPMPPVPSQALEANSNPLLSLLRLGPTAMQVSPIPEQATPSYP
ncbi:DCP2-domain-containing protein [Coprinopsis sp. MPI-PUGE-AT-0042]|nr:DCP2-domain-containing protein [Coprinopsis sp. MPI-PUGE-AT-0042]